ncbi:MAG: protease modulator HflC [Candidatus Delongbacteria bacterium]|nr:protease modulator HflC [Candidatus Delongbacteria bacterium]
MKRIITIVIGIFVLIIISSGLFIVKEMEQVVITQFGKPVGDPIVTAGIKFKIPLIQRAIFFEKRWLEWDGYPNQIPTRDKKYIMVDTYARWRIADPLKFYETVHNEISAHSRLDDILDGETRNAIANVDLIEIVRSTNRQLEVAIDLLDNNESTERFDIEFGRVEIQRRILAESAEIVTAYGIELVDVRIKRLLYIDEVLRKVYDRMISERQRIAEKLRSEGRGRSAEIRGEMEKELQLIQSEAYRTAQEKIGTADAEATGIYAAAYNRDPEFYGFSRTLEAYEEVIDSLTTIVLKTDGEFLQYLESTTGN